MGLFLTEVTAVIKGRFRLSTTATRRTSGSWTVFEGDLRAGWTVISLEGGTHGTDFTAMSSGESLDGGGLPCKILSLEASRWSNRECILEESNGDEPINRSQDDYETLHPDAVWRFTKGLYFSFTVCVHSPNPVSLPQKYCFPD